MTGAGVARVAPTGAIGVLRDQIAPGAADDELAFFGQVCARLDLSPFADQIVLIGRYDKRLGRKVHRPQVTVAGRRTLAARTGKLAGIEGPVWCGPRVRGELVWREIWDEDEPPYCARVLVWVTGWKVPANGTAKWSELAQTDQAGIPTPMWQKMPSHMLGKCAESLALRRAFPDVIDPAVALEDGAGWIADPDADDLGEITEATARHASGRPLVAPAGWTPTPADQAAAHRRVGQLPEPEQAVFLTNWDIETFGEVWPAAAVADALGLELQAPPT